MKDGRLREEKPGKHTITLLSSIVVEKKKRVFLPHQKNSFGGDSFAIKKGKGSKGKGGKEWKKLKRIFNLSRYHLEREYPPVIGEPRRPRGNRGGAGELLGGHRLLLERLDWDWVDETVVKESSKVLSECLLNFFRTSYLGIFTELRFGRLQGGNCPVADYGGRKELGYFLRGWKGITIKRSVPGLEGLLPNLKHKIWAKEKGEGSESLLKGQGLRIRRAFGFLLWAGRWELLAPPINGGTGQCGGERGGLGRSRLFLAEFYVSGWGGSSQGTSLEGGGSLKLGMR